MPLKTSKRTNRSTVDFARAACPGRRCRRTTSTKLKPPVVSYIYTGGENGAPVHTAGDMGRVVVVLLAGAFLGAVPSLSRVRG